MSISSMTNVAYRRRQDQQVAAAPATPAEVASSTSDATETQSAATAALTSIATYIPTEVVALYVAALAAVAASNPSIAAESSAASTTGGSIASSADLVTFWVFVALTPAIVWLVYAAKVRNAGKPVPRAPRTWPWWEMIAATVAFATWAYALPDSPFTRFSWYTTALGTFAVLIVSTLLGLIAPIVQKPLKP